MNEILAKLISRAILSPVFGFLAKPTFMGIKRKAKHKSSAMDQAAFLELALSM